MAEQNLNAELNALRHLIDALQLGGDFQLPQQMIQVRDDQVVNNAGGFVFPVDDVARVRRFLILSTDGGTYYVAEKELTIQNVAALIELIKRGKGGMILRECIDISLAGRAPKQEPTLLALALLARYNVKDRKQRAQQNSQESVYDAYLHKLQQAAFLAVKKICRIPTHLFTFVKYCEMVAMSTCENGEGQEKKISTGWGVAMRKCICEWYLQRPPAELAMHLTKYRNRAGYTHRDVLRLAHPSASLNNRSPGWPNEQTLVYDQLFHYAIHGEFNDDKGVLPPQENDAAAAEQPQMKKARCDYALTPQMVECAAQSDALELVRAVMEAGKQAKLGEQGAARCVELIRQHGLVREHIPTELLNSRAIWIALLEHMPMTALIRNLSKLSSLGLIDGKDAQNEKYVDQVVAKILDQQALRRARIHPIGVLLAAAVYEQGRGMKGSLSWEVNERVKNALDQCFQLAFHNVQPTNKRYCLALDVSGSMTSPISGGVLSCRTASAAMSSVFLRTEPLVECVAFQKELTVLPFTRDWSVTQMCEHIDRMDFGSTDCAQPMLWAAKRNKQFDVFIVFTDSETWAGKVHPFEALKQYRQKSGIPAKLAVMGMTATGFTLADPSDKGMVDIVGLDSAVPELLRAFVMDEI